MTDIAEVRRKFVLDKQMNYSAYGVLTRAEFIQRSLKDGCTLESVLVADDAKRNKLEKLFAIMNHGFNTPWGNQYHPKTIEALAVKKELAGPITKIEYRLNRPNGCFNVLTKTEFEYGVSL